MGALFLKLLNMSINASWLVLAVVILRVLLKKAPKSIRCVLWALVGIRLMVPFSFESVFSLLPSRETLPVEVIQGPSFDVHTGIQAIDQPVNSYLGDRYFEGVTVPSNAGYDLMTVLGMIWLLGVIAMALYTFISYGKLYKKVAPSLLLHENIYLCDHIASPFILGVLRPRIYLPSSMNEDQKRHVIAHERAHLRRRDHWWKPLGFLLLSVYWFNPVLWVAYVLLCRDIELACDEAVIRDMEAGEKKAYSMALLTCSMDRKMIAACPLAFGEVGVKERVMSVLCYKKPAFWLVIAAVIACIAAAVCFLTDPRELTEPWGHSYRTEEVCYQAGQYSFGYTTDNAPLFSLTDEGKLRVLESTDWLTAGTFEETDLDDVQFKRCFENNLPGGWAEGYSADGLKRGNERTWKLVVSPTTGSSLYYLLQQKDGSLYLIQGYYDMEGETDPASDDSNFRWVFKLEQTAMLSASLRQVGSEQETTIEMNYCRDGVFDEDYETLPETVFYSDEPGSIVFRVDGDCDSLSVSEDYYTETGMTSGEVAKESYTLTPSGQGEFVLPIEKRSGATHAVYYAALGESKYVFRIQFAWHVSELEEETGISYCYTESPDPIDPVLTLYRPDRFQFTYSAYSSYLAVGSYVQADDRLILTTDDGKNTYVFGIDGVDLIFDAEASSGIPEYRYDGSSQETKCPVPDGAVFTLGTGGLSVLGGDYSSSFAVSGLMPGEEAVSPVKLTFTEPGMFGYLFTYSRTGLNAELCLRSEESGTVLVISDGGGSMEGSYGAIPPGTYELYIKNLQESQITLLPTLDGCLTFTCTAVPSEEGEPVVIGALDRAVSEAILTRYSPEEPEVIAVESHKVLATEDMYGERLTAYIIECCSSYQHTDEQLEQTGGIACPAALTFWRNDEGGYELEEYWEPRDGSYYSDDIKGRFPDSVEEELFSGYTFYLDELSQSCLDQAMEQAETVPTAERMIENLFLLMMEEPLEASSPEAYIDAHPDEYYHLMEYDLYTLRWCFERFLSGEENGLKGQLMAYLCDDIMSTWGEDLHDSSIYENGQAWFEDFRLYTEAIQLRYDAESIEKHYPGSWTLIELMEEVK